MGVEVDGFVLHLVAAGRYGLIVMLGYWFIHAIGRTRAATASPPSVPTPLVSFTPVAPVIPPPGVFEEGKDKEGTQP